MDIQRQREAFEATSPFSIYMDKVERNGERYKPVHYKDLDYAQIMSFGWLAWQAAKAQKVAVPEGFVLVPTVPSERMVLAVRQCYEGEHYLPYSLYSEFINQAIIERMEAQGANP